MSHPVIGLDSFWGPSLWEPEALISRSQVPLQGGDRCLMAVPTPGSCPHPDTAAGESQTRPQVPEETRSNEMSNLLFRLTWFGEPARCLGREGTAVPPQEAPPQNVPV